MEFKAFQDVRGKIFTNGKFDDDRVAHTFQNDESKQALRRHSESGDVQKAAQILESDDSSTSFHSNTTQKELANTIFDWAFKTLLHLAVQSGSIELVKLLLEKGHKNMTNVLFF